MWCSYKHQIRKEHEQNRISLSFNGYRLTGLPKPYKKKFFFIITMNHSCIPSFCLICILYRNNLLLWWIRNALFRSFNNHSYENGSLSFSPYDGKYSTSFIHSPRVQVYFSCSQFPFCHMTILLLLWRLFSRHSFYYFIIPFILFSLAALKYSV